MQQLEKYLVDLDSGASGAIFRVTLGLCIPPVFRALSGGRDQIWIELGLFLALLVALRVGSAVLRKVLPFSAEVKKIWFDRRQIAKLHDSYQWQKLFWIGLGLLPHALPGNGLTAAEMVLAAICLIGGGAGLLIWRRVGGAPAAAQIKAPALNQSKA